MKQKLYILGIAASLGLTLASCNREKIEPAISPTLPQIINPSLVYHKPTTAQEINLVANLEKITTVFKSLYQLKANLDVVNASIKSRAYTDESVLLKDLIYPDGSLLAKNPRFIAYAQKYNLSLNAFAANFWSAANKLNDPNFVAFLAKMKPASGTASTLRLAEDQVSLYFPYDDRFLPELGDDISYGPVTSLVTATADADVGWGTQPYTDASGVTQYRSILIDDAYAEMNPTHIIGINGIEPYNGTGSGGYIASFVPSGPIKLPDAPREIKQVYVGEVRCKRQFDSFISFTGNGGGSEIRFTRADGFLKFVDGQVQPDVYVSGTKTITRSEIGKHRFVTYSSEWDGDWPLDNLNQNLAIFEEDNRNEVEVSGSITTTLKTMSGNATVVGTIGFKKTFKSDDELILQVNVTRASFFPLNRTDLEDEMQNNWPVRAKSADVSYTLQDRTYIP